MHKRKHAYMLHICMRDQSLCAKNEVIDEACRAKVHRNCTENGAVADCINLRNRLKINHFHIVDTRERLGFDDVSHGRKHGLCIALASFYKLFSFENGARHAKRTDTFLI